MQLVGTFGHLFYPNIWSHWWFSNLTCDRRNSTSIPALFWLERGLNRTVYNGLQWRVNRSKIVPFANLILVPLLTWKIWVPIALKVAVRNWAKISTNSNVVSAIRTIVAYSQRTLTYGRVSLYGRPPVYFVWIQLLYICWMSNSFTCLDSAALLM